MIKPTKWHVHPVKTPISLGLRHALNGKLRTQAFFIWTAKSLIRLGVCLGWSVFAGRTCHFVGFVMRQLMYTKYEHRIFYGLRALNELKFHDWCWMNFWLMHRQMERQTNRQNWTQTLRHAINRHDKKDLTILTVSDTSSPHVHWIRPDIGTNLNT